MSHNLLLQIKWTDELTVIILSINVLVTLLVTFIANHLAMKYWRKQKREEINFQLESLRYSSRMEAAKAVWGLLAFLTEKENGKCFLIYKGTKEKPEIYFDLDRGRKYLHSLSEIFYEQGHGVFLTSELKKNIFHIRTHVYQILDKENRRNIEHGEVLLENPGIVDFFRTRYEELRSKIASYTLTELKHEIQG